MLPLFSTAMDQSSQQLARQNLIAEIEAFKKKIDNPTLYDTCGEVLLHKFGSPIPFIDYIISTMRRNPELKLKDIQCGGKPMVQLFEEEQSLQKRALCAGLLVFLKEHGC